MVIAFIRRHRPRVCLMGPTCAPFGGWARLNQVNAPEGWARSFDNAAPHGSFCAEVAMEQMHARPPRSFACEQPRSSKLWHLHPWPQVLAKPEVMAVHFDQCTMGQHYQN
eukprot:6284302-Amphidinium_carterae.1